MVRWALRLARVARRSGVGSVGAGRRFRLRAAAGGRLGPVPTPAGGRAHTAYDAAGSRVESGREPVRTAAVAAVPLGLNRRDFSAAHAGAGRRSVCGAARSGTGAVRRWVPDDLRLQSLQRLGCEALVRPVFPPSRLSAADPAHAFGAAYARFAGAPQ